MSYFCHNSFGNIYYTLEDERLWAFVCSDIGITEYYRVLARKHGIKITKTGRDPHITFVRGETITNPAFLTEISGKSVQYQYSNQLRQDNGHHAWLDVWCPELHEIRTKLGLPQKAKMSFHMTLGHI